MTKEISDLHTAHGYGHLESTTCETSNCICITVRTGDVAPARTKDHYMYSQGRLLCFTDMTRLVEMITASNATTPE